MGTRKIFIAALVTLVLIGWGVVAAPPAQQPERSVAVATPQTIFLDRCFIKWADERIISSKIPGRLGKRFVKDGQKVEEGQELARLDDREAQAEYDIQKLLGESELDELMQYEKYIEYLARKDAADRLVNPRAISLEEWRLAQVNVKVNELMTRKEAEKHKVEKLKAERTKIFLDEHYVTSPIQGIVRKCFKRENEAVAANDLQLFHIVATDRLWVEGHAHVRDVYRVKTGQSVVVRLTFQEAGMSSVDPGQLKDAKPSLSPGLTTQTKPATGAQWPSEQRLEMKQEKIEFRGSVVYIDPEVESVNRNFRVRAEVENQYDPETKEPILRSGLMAVMTIELGEPADEPANEKKE